MLLAIQLLTKQEYDSALSKGVTVFLYNEIEFVSEPKEGITLVNCTTERVPSTWFTWQQNEKAIESFKKKFPQFFLLGGYNISLALLKALYWSNQKTGFLQYVKNKYFKETKVWKEDMMFKSRNLNVFLKYYYALFRHKSQSEDFTQIEKNGKIGFFIKNEFQVTLYKYIIKQCIENEHIVIFIMDNKVKEAIVKLGLTKNRIVFCDNISKRKIPCINYLLLKSQERFILNQILNNWKEVEKWIGVAEQMVSHGISKALINEAENGLFGAVLGEVFQKHGVISYNTMNGMKSGQAQDSFINFDYWFVWDDKMKELLMQKNKLPERKLIVSGHLMEDEVRNYKYQNSLPLTIEKIKGKKVISLFSVRGKREEKLEAFEYLYELAKVNSNIILLVRPHYSEKVEDYITPNGNNSNVIFIYNELHNSKKTLYDQLYISTLSICFGSTVALESKWFGVPCITFEKREKSLIYAVDDLNIFHVKNKEDLKMKNLNVLKQTLNKSKINVAKSILKEINV